MIEVVRRLDPRRWTVHVACIQKSGAWLDRAAAGAASIDEFPIRTFRGTGALASMHAFAAWCRARRIAVVHTAELYSNIFALPGAAFAQVPVRIGSRRELVADKTPGQLALQRAAYTCAHKVVANAEASAALLRRELVPGGKVVVVPNGLDLTLFDAAPGRTPRRRIVMVANLRPGKGHTTLIDAAAIVRRTFPDAHVDFVGDGTERHRLAEYIRARGLTAAFTFHGHCEDVPARLSAADVCVLPSESEAFPNAVLEAMAAARPVVASAVGGILEVVQHERTGLLVPPGDVDALAAALIRVLTDHETSARMAAAGRALVEARYSFDRMIAALEALYLAELTRRPAGLAALSRAAV